MSARARCAPVRLLQLVVRHVRARDHVDEAEALRRIDRVMAKYRVRRARRHRP